MKNLCGKNNHLRCRAQSVATLLAMTVILSSCMVGPDFVQPKAPPVTAYTSEKIPERC